MKLILTIDDKYEEDNMIVLAERNDNNYAQLYKDARLPFVECLSSIPTPIEMIDEISLTALDFDKRYYATKVVE